MRDLPLNALRALAAVYEAGGVRPAARALQVSHSAVSRHLSELEARLGAPLLEDRGGRGSVLTAQGEALGRASLAALRGLESAVAAQLETRSGNAVVIATTPSFAARWLLPRLASLEAVHPWIDVSVHAEQMSFDPADRGADLALRMGKGPWRGLDCEPLMADRLYPVMSRDLWDRTGRPAAPPDLTGQRLLHDRDPNAAWAAWRDAFGPPSLDVGKGPRFASSDLVLRAAAQGLGVALARGRLAADDVASGALVRPMGEREIVLPDAYWIVRSPDRRERGAVSAVVEWLKGSVGTEAAT